MTKKQYRVKGNLLRRYKVAKTRSTHMKLHWKIARKIQKDWNIPLGDARRAATAHVRDEKLVVGVVGHLYETQVIDEEGKTYYFMVHNKEKRLSNREVLKQAREIWEINRKKYEVQGITVDIKELNVVNNYYTMGKGVRRK